MTDDFGSFRPKERPSTPARWPFELGPNQQRLLAVARAGLAEEFKGITTDGEVVPGLFSVQASGVSTEPLRDAATAFLAALSAEQRAAATFDVDDEAWRSWSNVHFFMMRHGVCLEDLTEPQRERALDLLKVSLSATGYETARDIMKLNETIGEITGRWDDYGQWVYWLSILGTPSADGPWGWQIDGHHLIVNCFVLGDQLVMTPSFLGSEPVVARSGKHAGTRVFEAEEARGLALMQALTPEQRQKATIGDGPPYEGLSHAFRDNLQIPYRGIRHDELSRAHQALLLELIETYVGQIRPGHAEIRLEEVKEHLGETYFGWMGGCEDDSVFYYRVHSPVILIEFDHQAGLALDNDRANRNHIHTVVRTPNGNDYGKDLLRQHYALHHHAQRVPARE